MTSRLQDALAGKPHVWGGWVVVPTVITLRGAPSAALEFATRDGSPASQPTSPTARASKVTRARVAIVARC